MSLYYVAGRGNWVRFMKGKPMKTKKREEFNLRRISYGIVFLAGAVVFSVLAGCDQPLGPGETYHRLTSAWPIFDLEKSEGVGENGIRWKKEKGDAVCWLASWEKEQRFDKDNFLIYRKERNTFFPFYSTEVEESEEFIHKWGTVLFYPYRSKRIKTPRGGMPLEEPAP